MPTPASPYRTELPRPEHPRPQFVRPDWRPLNGEWEFEVDQGDSGLERGLRDRPLAGTIVVPFAPESKRSGVERTDFLEAVWYQRTVDGGTRWQSLTQTAQHDFLHAGGWLVVGAMTAATLQVVVPRSVLDGVANHQVLAVLALAVLAVVLAVCSEADAFVAASLNQFSLTARLVFMVVGPVVDLKLVALQTGVFGRRFAPRFAPLTLAVAIFFGSVVGWWLL